MVLHGTRHGSGGSLCVLPAVRAAHHPDPERPQATAAHAARETGTGSAVAGLIARRGAWELASRSRYARSAPST
ncbi:hypothetical protein MASSI9I_10069 [Massilia sp. 9I]|nr:hypothetical protein MASSI9I_10069 [Massilia sp. 9I]